MSVLYSEMYIVLWECEHKPSWSREPGDLEVSDDDSVKTRTADERINSFLGDTGKLEPGRGGTQVAFPLLPPGLQLQRPGATSGECQCRGVALGGRGWEEESNCTPPTLVRGRGGRASKRRLYRHLLPSRKRMRQLCRLRL